MSYLTRKQRGLDTDLMPTESIWLAGAIGVVVFVLGFAIWFGVLKLGAWYVDQRIDTKVRVECLKQ